MAKVFKVTPKRIKRANGLVLAPDMSVVVHFKMIYLHIHEFVSKSIVM